MSQPPLPDDHASPGDNRPGRRVFFVRLDRPQSSQGPHWVDLPAVIGETTNPPGASSLAVPPTGNAGSLPPDPGPRPGRQDAPLPLAAQAIPAPPSAERSTAGEARTAGRASSAPQGVSAVSTLRGPHFRSAPANAPVSAEAVVGASAVEEAVAAAAVDATPITSATGPTPAPVARRVAPPTPGPAGLASDPLQTHVRQLVVHLQQRHRELRRRQRSLRRQEAELARQRTAASAASPAVESGEPAQTAAAVAAARADEREAELLALADRLRIREEQLDRERTALDQLRAEVAARHQEALEMRLACEQLWAQLASRLEVPRLIESIAQLRRRLAEQYQGAAWELAQQREEARQLVARLDDRQQQLRRQRAEVQAWVMRRHEELEWQHVQLLKRQQELDARERAQQQLHAEIQQQVAEYQRKIRQLTAQLRCKQELSRLA